MPAVSENSDTLPHGVKTLSAGLTNTHKGGNTSHVAFYETQSPN